MKKILLLLLVIFLIGCTKDTVQVCIEKQCFDSELVSTPEEMQKGLMFRTSLEGGMLFAFDSEKVAKFWMKNTLIPLDMIWIHKNKVIHVERDVQPCREDPCPNYGPDAVAGYVLEVNALILQQK